MENLEKQFVQVGDIQLHVVMAGPADGAPLFFLHGFPEFWYGWRAQIPFFAEQGYRVIVPDQRGYNLSDKPEGIDAYSIGTLAADVIGLADALGYEQFNLVGHDWGGAVSWLVAQLYPERLRRLIVLNVPHHRVMAAQLRGGNFAQMAKSWYMFAFQVPNVPEIVLSANEYDALIRGMLAIGVRGSFKRDDFGVYKQAWSQPGALTGMINWYRSGLRVGGSSGNGTRQPRIQVPTLLLWGEQDGALGREMAKPSIDLCDYGELVYFPNASHWIQHDDPDGVNKMTLEFLQQEIEMDESEASTTT